LSKDNLVSIRRSKILDRDHYDLEKVKKRLIEYLAVRKNSIRRDTARSFVFWAGPASKTSLGQSTADASAAKFVRISLGGMRDEAEIRGHRRTYIARAGPHHSGIASRRYAQSGFHAR